MKKLFVALLILAGTYAWYTNLQEKKQQTELLKKEVAALEQQNQALARKAQNNEQRAKEDEGAQTKRVAELKSKLETETAKLTVFQQRRTLLTAALNDPGQATSMAEVNAEIKEKNEAIQSLQLQLSSNQEYEKNVEHNGEAAKQTTQFTKAQTLADLNGRIRAQEQLIRNTQDSLRSTRIAGDVNATNQLTTLNSSLAQQRVDLQALKAAKDQVNQAASVQNIQIHQQVGYEKGEIRASEQQIRAQIESLKIEISSLQAQKTGSTRSKSQVQQQATHVDQQIAAQKTIVSQLQELLKAEKQ